MIAHVSGVPVEELLPLAYSGGALWLTARAYMSRAKGPSR